MGQHEIAVTIRARDEASAVLDKSTANLIRTGLRLGGWSLGLHAASDVVRAGFAAARGDAEAFYNALEQLPAGLGATVSAVSALVDEVGGFSREIERVKKQSDELGKFAQGVVALGRERQKWKLEISLIGMSEIDKQLAGVREKVRTEQERLRDEGKRAGWNRWDPRIATAEAQVADWGQRQRQQLRIADDAKRAEAARVDALAKIDKAQKEAADRAEEIARREGATAAQRAEIANRLFDLMHDAREKELHDIDLFYADAIERAEGGLSQIAEIQEAWATETAAAMNRQREAAEEDTGRRMAEGGLPEGGLPEAVAARARGDWRALESRFLHWAPGTAPGGGAVDPAIAQGKEQIALLKGMHGFLQTIAGKAPVVLKEGKT
jgi:hypothetical protein